MKRSIYKCPFGHDLEKTDYGSNIYKCDKCLTKWVIRLLFGEYRFTAFKFFPSENINIEREIDYTGKIEYIKELDVVMMPQYKCPLGHYLEKTDDTDFIPHVIYKCAKCITRWVMAFVFSDNKLRAGKYPDDGYIDRDVDDEGKIEYIPELDDKPLPDNKEIP